jgi:DNA-3-methyladenine glycosylase
MAFAPNELARDAARNVEAPVGRQPPRLHRRDLPVDTAELARYLIGKTLVHDMVEGRISGRIVETEAYVVGDAAGHAFRGLTRRNRSLFLDRGHAYVHISYGLHFMINVTSEVPGIGAGVLLRALEPLEGLSIMSRLRGDVAGVELARGPGNLTQAFAIDFSYDGTDLCAPGPLWLAAPIRPPGNIGSSTRIGISRETQRLLRFYERGNPFVSGPKRLRP